MKAILMFMAVMPFLINAQSLESKLSIGDSAPEFSGLDQFDQEFSLSEALKDGSILVIFYRGEWCGYCNRYLSEVQDHLSDFEGKNIRVVGISPQNNLNREKTIAHSDLSFSLLIDSKSKISDAYGLTFELDEKTMKKYERYGIDLIEVNSDDKYALPVPATFLIDSKGTIQFVHYDPDYSNRANILEILGE